MGTKSSSANKSRINVVSEESIDQIYTVNEAVIYIEFNEKGFKNSNIQEQLESFKNKAIKTMKMIINYNSVLDSNIVSPQRGGSFFKKVFDVFFPKLFLGVYDTYCEKFQKDPLFLV